MNSAINGIWIVIPCLLSTAYAGILAGNQDENATKLFNFLFLDVITSDGVVNGTSVVKISDRLVKMEYKKFDERAVQTALTELIEYLLTKSATDKSIDVNSFLNCLLTIQSGHDDFVIEKLAKIMFGLMDNGRYSGRITAVTFQNYYTALSWPIDSTVGAHFDAIKRFEDSKAFDEGMFLLYCKSTHGFGIPG